MSNRDASFCDYDAWLAEEEKFALMEERINVQCLEADLANDYLFCHDKE